MKIQAVHIDGFGCLVNVEYALVDGMNIFFGPNEIGKSTLQQAILALLYGFYTKNRRNVQEDALLERFRPWRGAKFGGQLEYKLENDNRSAFRVLRDFNGDLETHLEDALTRRELSQDFEHGRLGRIDFAPKHLGLELPVFINTSFVRQSDLHQLDEVAAKISETIINLADTGSRDHSVVNARTLLEKALENQVGKERATTKPLAAAKTRLQQVEAEYEYVLQLRQKRESDSLARQTYQTQLQELEIALARVNYLQTRQKLAALDARLEQIRALRTRQAETQKEFDELAALADFPSYERDHVLRLAQTRATQRARVENSDALADQARAALETLEQQAAPLRDQVRALEPARTIPVEQQPQAQELERKWREAQRECNTARTQLDEAVRKITEQRVALPEPEADAAYWRAELEWLAKQRVAWQTARARAVEAKERENAARNTWRTRALALPELAPIAHLSDASSTSSHLQHALDRTDFLLARQERDALNARMDALEKLLMRRDEIKPQLDALEFVSQFPLDTRDELLRLESLWRAQLTHCAQQDELAERARRDMRELETQAASLRASSAALEHARTVPMERADEIRALREIWRERRDAYAVADTQWQEIETTIARKQEFKTVLEKYQALLALPPEKFSALRNQWIRTRERVTQAQARWDAASNAWRAAGMDETKFERLQEQLVGVDATLLDEWKAPPVEKSAALSQRAHLVLFVAGAMFGIGGLILLALGNLFVGAGLLAGATLFLGIGFLLRAQRKTNTAPQVDARITTRGFANFQEMEPAFATLQTARPLHEELHESERALQTARAELMPLSRELDALLQLANTDALSAETLDAWETRLSQWRAEISELAALGKTRAEREQRRRDATLARDAAAEPLRRALAECGFGGDNDLERATHAFLTRCDERARLEFLDTQWSFRNSQLETKRAIIQQAEHARREARRLENELRILLARAQLADEDMDAALTEYHRRAEFGAQYRVLEQESLVLERECRVLTQTESFAQMQTRRATLQTELARLVTQHPEFDVFEATTKHEQLKQTHSALREMFPVVENWRNAAEALTDARAQFANVRAEIAARLNLSSTNSLTEETLTTAEQQRQQWLDARRQLDALQTEWTQRQSEYETASSNERDAAEELRAILRAANFDAVDLARDTREFLAQCEKRKTLERVESELRAFDAQSEAKHQVVQEAHDARGELDATENALRELLARAGIGTDDLTQAVAEFDARFERATQRRALGETLGALQGQLRAHLAGELLEQIETQHDALTHECEELLQTHPSFDTLEDTITLAQLEQERARLEQQRIRVHSELGAIGTRLAPGETTRTVAEIEEELASLRERIGTLTAHGLALNLAIEYLEKAADEQHRNFLPRLNQIVSESLRVVTDGRYQNVSIDHQDFQVRLQIPERAMPVTPDQLSRGAQEQIYLLLRLGLTELMSASRERLPLILDDPLVNYDRARLHHALDFLANLAAHSQILLFTKDEAIAEWFLDKKLDGTVHKLHWMDAADEARRRQRVQTPSPNVAAIVPTKNEERDAPPAPNDDVEPNPTAVGQSISSTYTPVRVPPPSISQAPNMPVGRPPQRPPETSPTPTPTPRTRARKPELVCWERQGVWHVAVEMLDELDQGDSLRVSQNGAELSSDSSNEARWKLNNLSDEIRVSWDADESHDIHLKPPLIFKLRGDTQREARRVRAATAGTYLVIVPESWRRDETVAGAPFRRPEPTAFDGFTAHLFALERGGATKIVFRDSAGSAKFAESRAPRFEIVGTRLSDAGEGKGPLFGGELPRLKLLANENWDGVGTIVVGREGRGRERDNFRLELDTTRAEQILPVDSKPNHADWFFARVYDVENDLIESLDFRFSAGLQNIALEPNNLLPTANGHIAAQILFRHNAAYAIEPADELAKNLAIVRDTNETGVEIPPEPKLDVTRWRIGSGEYSLEIPVNVERVWWAFDTETSESPNWQDRSLALALGDFDATSDKAFLVRLPAPRWAERARLRIGREFRTLNARVNESVACCALREFENAAHTLPLGIHALQLEIQHSEKSYAAQVGELRIAARCKKCDYETLNENDMLEHVRHTHLAEYFRPLKYDELVNIDPTLPREIYRCNFPGCLYYSTHDPKLSPTSAIHEHGKKHPMGMRPFQKLQDANVIRERVIKNLLDADKCALCGHDLKHPTNAIRWEHLWQKHRSRLFDRV